MLKKIFFVLFGVVIGLLIAEASLWALFKIKDRPAEKQVVDETRKIYQYDSMMGWRLAPNGLARQKNNEFDAVYETNSQGFRDDRDYFMKAEKERIITFGDSFAFGVGVENKQTFSKILEKRTNYEVFNFSVSGYDPGQYLLSLKNEGLKYNPDIVIYSIYLGNDIEDMPLNHPFQGDRHKPYFIVANDELILSGVPVPDKQYESETTDYRIKNMWLYGKIGWVLELRTALLFKNYLKQGFYPVLEKLGLVKSIRDYDKNFDVLDKILGETNEIIGDNKFIVLIIPSKNIKSNYLEARFEERLRTVLISKNIPFVSMTEEVEANDNLYFIQEGHFNERGHLIAAEKIIRLIENK